MSTRDLDDQAPPERRRGRAVAVVAVSVLLLAVGVGLRLGPPARALRPPPVVTTAPSAPPAANISSRVIGLQFQSRLTGWAMVTERPRTGAAGLFVTHDGGRTWSLLLEGAPGRFHFFDEERGWVDSTAVLRTTDGGRTWAAPGFGGFQYAFFSPEAGLRLQAGGGGVAILSTIDGGLTWQRSAGGDAEAFGFTGADLPDLRVGVAGPGLAWLTALSPGRVPAISISHDGGASWRSRPLPAPAPGLVAATAAVAGGADTVSAVAIWTEPANLVVTGNRVAGVAAGTLFRPYAYTLVGDAWVSAKLTGGGFLEPVLAAEGIDSLWVAVGPTLCHVSSGLAACHQAPPSEPQSLQLLQRVEGALIAYDGVTQSIVASADGGNHWTLIPKPTT